MDTPAPLIAAIEAGGTKFVVAVGSGPDDIKAITRIETTDPTHTLRETIQFLSSACRKFGPVQAIGVGSFGPVDLDPASATYGFITTTPKPGWQHTPIIAPLHSRFQVPVGFDTDVNAAAIGEMLWGAGKDCDPLVYITIGTGVGGGVIVGQQPLHGLLHPEIGHLAIPSPRTAGVLVQDCHCPYHKSCLEGFVSGPAIAARWGIRGEDMPGDHPALEEVAETLAYGLVNVILTLSPKRIILGGGVMKQKGLMESVRSHTVRLLNGYVHASQIIYEIDHYIVPPGLGDRSGICGALALGLNALAEAKSGKV
ncbi:MAG: Fructokinase [Verrucomicrobiaceae bacterium]|nr:Fructokinase [Verrucomicrobiaceae bacterium]